MDKTVEINEFGTFIKATREEALALAYNIGGGEVHALHIQGGFGMPAEKPVGYLVSPLKREWEKLDVNDAMNLIAEHITDPSPKLRYEIYGLIAEADMLLQEKNT